MNDKIREIINNSMKRELGMTYDEFELLNFDEQQRLIEQNRQRKRKKSKSNKVRLMVGSGEHSILVTKKRGERYMLSDGTLVIAGDTPEESRERLEKKLDDLTSSKPMTFVKKLRRKNKKKIEIYKNNMFLIHRHICNNGDKLICSLSKYMVK